MRGLVGGHFEHPLFVVMLIAHHMEPVDAKIAGNAGCGPNIFREFGMHQDDAAAGKRATIHLGAAHPYLPLCCSSLSGPRPGEELPVIRRIKGMMPRSARTISSSASRTVICQTGAKLGDLVIITSTTRVINLQNL